MTPSESLNSCLQSWGSDCPDGPGRSGATRMRIWPDSPAGDHIPDAAATRTCHRPLPAGPRQSQGVRAPHSQKRTPPTGVASPPPLPCQDAGGSAISGVPRPSGEQRVAHAPRSCAVGSFPCPGVIGLPAGVPRFPTSQVPAQGDGFSRCKGHGVPAHDLWAPLTLRQIWLW
jgi:hypothetical protein